MRLRRRLFLLSAAASSLALASCGAPPNEARQESASSVLSADGIPIHYEVQGSGEVALVFVHGWSCDRTYWEAQVPYFSGQHTVVTIDLAGHGESGLGRDEWSMEAFGQDVAAVVEELDLQQVVLIGHSMGGPVVAEAARQLNDRVVGVVGVDTFNDLSMTYSDEEVQGFMQGFQADFSGAMREVVGTMFVPGSDPELASWIAEDMSSGDPAVGMGALEGMIAWFNTASRDVLRALPAPLHLINSDYNPTNVEAGREAVGSFDAVFMSGVGHFVMMEDPETFNALLSEAITAFLPTSASLLKE